MAANPIPQVGPASVDSNGILNVWVQQPTSSVPSETKDEVTYTEKYKGPYSAGKDILASICYNKPIAEVHTALGGSSIVSRYNAPNPVQRWGRTGAWLVKSINVEERDAGAHCILTIVYYENFGGFETSTLVESQKDNTWSVSWQAYSVSPYAFCSNKGYVDKAQSPVGEVATPEYGEGKATRANIQRYIDNPAAVISSDQFPNKICYTYYSTPEHDDQRQALSPAECVIYNKIVLQRNATYHYPLVTHQTAFTGGSTSRFTEDLGEDLDTVSDAIQDCPYDFADSWQWIKIGDTMSMQKTETQTKFTRQETWMGTKNPDLNFYGDDTFDPSSAQGLLSSRWELEKL